MKIWVVTSMDEETVYPEPVLFATKRMCELYLYGLMLEKEWDCHWLEGKGVEPLYDKYTVSELRDVFIAQDYTGFFACSMSNQKITVFQKEV